MNILRCTVADASNIKVQHIFNMLKAPGQSLSAVEVVHPVQSQKISVYSTPKVSRIGVLGLATWKFSLRRHLTLDFAAEQQRQVNHLHQK